MAICDDLWPSARRELIIGTRYIREVYISDVPAGQRTGVLEIKCRTATSREFRVNILLDSRLENSRDSGRPFGIGYCSVRTHTQDASNGS